MGNFIQKEEINMPRETIGMTASKYVKHLTSFARIATYAHKPRLALQALKYYRQAVNCVPKNPLVINIITYSDHSQEIEKEQQVDTGAISEKIFFPSSQRSFELLKQNYKNAMKRRQLSIALQILKEIGEEIGMYNKNNYTKEHFITKFVSDKSEAQDD